MNTLKLHEWLTILSFFFHFIRDRSKFEYSLAFGNCRTWVIFTLVALTSLAICRAGNKERAAISKDTVSMNICCLKAFSSDFDKQAKIRLPCEKGKKKVIFKLKHAYSQSTQYFQNILHAKRMLVFFVVVVVIVFLFRGIIDSII